MKPRTLLVTSTLLLGFLGYQFWSSENVATSEETAAVEANVEKVDDSRDVVADLEPRAISQAKIKHNPKEEEVQEAEASIPPPREVLDEPVANTEEIIAVKAPPEREGQPGIVNLVSNENENPPEREKLDNVQQSFSNGKDAVKVFGDALNALNGTYTGEVFREGKEPCPLSLVIDGFYSPQEGSKEADFTGNFQMNYECGSGHSRGSFDGQFGRHAKVIGENANTLIMKDGGGNFFQISFSRDFQTVTGNVYQTPYESQPEFLGKIKAHR